MASVIIAIGTNLGDRSANLAAALHALAEGTRVLAVSPIYETPPWGVIDQPPYYNQVVEVETVLLPHDLLRFLKATEARIGRRPDGMRYGPRLIDFDIALYGDVVLTSYSLTIPHPRLVERAFVLAPLADIAPDRKHPRLGLTVREMLARIDASDIQRLPQ